MKYQAVLVLLAISLASASYICPKFSCASSYELGLDEVCSTKTNTSTSVTFQLRLCASTSVQNCSFSFSSSASSCMNATVPDHSLLPGEPCAYSDYCISDQCVSGYCVGNETGSVCGADYDCRPGTYCNTKGKCAQLVAEGMACGGSDGVCANHLVCVNNNCTRIGSLVSGNNSNDPLACQTMYIASNSLGVQQCAAGLNYTNYTAGTVPECTMGSMCNYTNGIAVVYSSPCKCGVNGDGKGYCHPGEGNMADDVSIFLNMTGTVYDPPCHISNPWFCKRRLADNSAIYHKAFLAYKNLTTPEMFVNNDYCVQWDINRDYWVSYNVVHPYQKKDSDAGIALTSSATIFIALLLIELALLI